MMAFLSFQHLISIEVLIFFYYLGAVMMPLFTYWLYAKLKNLMLERHSSLGHAIQLSSDTIASALSFSTKVKLITLSIFVFLFAELFWRLLFEFLIAFMQMRDALVTTQ